ncbi:rCG47448 [Rattus norvegicus]|uniref:RCG47448 n=1 Tax=Rattus norvegicus TaxID=10116 RepID=A6I078_RAT|nr:rCG47448 [Rattus norvegicus]
MPSINIPIILIGGLAGLCICAVSSLFEYVTSHKDDNRDIGAQKTSKEHSKKSK